MTRLGWDVMVVTVREPEGHHKPFVGAVPHVESGLPFVAISDVNEMVCMAKVDLGVDLHVA